MGSYLLLFFCQGLSVIATTGNSLIASLNGLFLAPAPEMITILNGAIALGLVLATIPSGRLTLRLGRKAMIQAGALVGLSGCVAAIGATMVGNFWLLGAASLLIGGAGAFANTIRYAIAEVVSSTFRPHATALGSLLGLLGCFMGPAMAMWGLRDDALSVWSYLAIGGVYTSMLVVASFVPGRSVTEQQSALRRDPIPMNWNMINIFLAAGGAGIYMAMLMNGFPGAMVACGLGATEIAAVLNMHFIGMFAPSLVVGWAIKHFGWRRVMLAGVTLPLVGFTINQVVPLPLMRFQAELLLCGVAWNLMLTSGLYAITLTQEIRGNVKVQTMFNFLLIIPSAAAAFVSGPLVHLLGWRGLLVICASVPLLLAISLVAETVRRRQVLIRASAG